LTTVGMAMITVFVEGKAKRMKVEQENLTLQALSSEILQRTPQFDDEAQIKKIEYTLKAAPPATNSMNPNPRVSAAIEVDSEDALKAMLEDLNQGVLDHLYVNAVYDDSDRSGDPGDRQRNRTLGAFRGAAKQWIAGLVQRKMLWHIAELSACLSVPVFLTAFSLLLMEHQQCPGGASSNPDDDPLTDDNPRNCSPWSQCIDPDSLECTAKEPDGALLAMYYFLLMISGSICSLFLYRTKCLRAYNRCAHWIGTNHFRYFLTLFVFFAVVGVLLSLGFVFAVEGAMSCPSNSWKLSPRKRLFNPNHCVKCVRISADKQCVEDWDIDPRLLELGAVLILLSLAFASGGCWHLISRRKYDDHSLFAREEVVHRLNDRVRNRKAKGTRSRNRDNSTMPRIVEHSTVELAVMPSAVENPAVDTSTVGRAAEEEKESECAGHGGGTAMGIIEESAQSAAKSGGHGDGEFMKQSMGRDSGGDDEIMKQIVDEMKDTAQGPETAEGPDDVDAAPRSTAGPSSDATPHRVGLEQLSPSCSAALSDNDLDSIVGLIDSIVE